MVAGRGINQAKVVVEGISINLYVKINCLTNMDFICTKIFLKKVICTPCITLLIIEIIDLIIIYC